VSCGKSPTQVTNAPLQDVGSVSICPLHNPRRKPLPCTALFAVPVSACFTDTLYIAIITVGKYYTFCNPSPILGNNNTERLNKSVHFKIKPGIKITAGKQSVLLYNNAVNISTREHDLIRTGWEMNHNPDKETVVIPNMHS
jgi:hypothetical protein